MRRLRPSRPKPQSVVMTSRSAGMFQRLPDQASHVLKSLDEVLSAPAPAGGYQSSWGTLLLVLGGMKRDAVPGMSINGRQEPI
jgi:hypothetical protein